MKVCVFESEAWIESAWQAMDTGLEPVWVQGVLPLASMENFADAEIISTDLSVLNAASLSALGKLKLIAVRATGVDNIDLEYCRKNGIAVCNVPAYAQNAVAEHVFSLLLALGRHVIEASLRTRRLDFSWDGLQGFELHGKTIAVIGTGAIGKRVAAIARGFGMRVVAADAFPDEDWAKNNDVEYVALEEALKAAEVVTLHVPGMPETCHLLSSERFELMKDGVVIVNTSRGDVVDPRALLEALASGKVAAAGLDVLPEEDSLIQEKNRLQVLLDSQAGSGTQLANHLLLQHPRVLVTPHCAFFTREAAERLMQVTVDNIDAFIRGEHRNIVT
ncbi:MAG: NAD(P)-dependent oxidoreductase [Thermodesulfobacteriota bacterium]